MNKPLLKLLFAILALSTSMAQAHVPHDIIYSLDVSPTFSKDGLIFASSTQFGAAHLVSTNHGETFSESHAGMQKTLVTGHAFSPSFASDGVVYSVSNEGYYKSTDRGKNWTKQNLFSDEPVLSICFDKNANDIYVLTKTAVHKLVNGSSESPLKTFDEATFGKLELAGGRLFVHRVYYDTPKKLKGMELVEYLSGTVDALDVKSGQWTQLASDFESEIIADIDVTSDGNSIAVSLKSGSVHRSDDGGKSWSNVFKRDGDFVCKVKFSPSYKTDNTIVCGSAKGFMFLSEDRGAKWETRANGLSRWVHHVNIMINKIEFSPNYEDDKTIFLGKTTGFYKTTDSGKFWRHVNVWNPKWGYYVFPAPGDSGDVFTATYNSGISRSSDMGDTWNSANVGITSAFANGMELSPNYAEDKSIFVMDIATGLYRSSDGGKSWTKIEEMDTAELSGNPVLYRELGISSDFKDDGLILIFSVPRRTLGVKEKHCFTFNVNTKELKRVMIGPKSNYINDFAFTPTGSKQKMMFAASAKGAFVSRDDGNTWEPLFNARGGITNVIVSPDFDNDGTIYLKSGRGELLVSKDAGKSFAKTKLGAGPYIQNLIFSPNFGTDKTLYVTTHGEGVFRSRDAGKTWKYLGLKGKWIYTGPTFSSNYKNDKTMFAPAVDGIYRSTDDGATWKNVLNYTQFLPKVPFLTLKDSQGQDIPLHFGTVKQMKSYGVYDEDIGAKMYRPTGRKVEKISDARAYLASYYKFRVEKGASAEVYFYGKSIEYKCVQDADMGIVDIEIDGKSRGQFDLYNETKTFDVTGFSDNSLEEGFHTLRIVSTGEKNPASSGNAFTFNAANIKN